MAGSCSGAGSKGRRSAGRIGLAGAAFLRAHWPASAVGVRPRRNRPLFVRVSAPPRPRGSSVHPAVIPEQAPGRGHSRGGLRAACSRRAAKSFFRLANTLLVRVRSGPRSTSSSSSASRTRSSRSSTTTARASTARSPCCASWWRRCAGSPWPGSASATSRAASRAMACARSLARAELAAAQASIQTTRTSCARRSRACSGRCTGRAQRLGLRWTAGRVPRERLRER